MKEKILKMLEFARAGIYYNYQQPEESKPFIEDLRELENHFINLDEAQAESPQNLLGEVGLNLVRRLNRLQKMKADYELKTNGKEKEFTFYGGYDLGFISGKIAEIENILDIFKIDY